MPEKDKRYVRTSPKGDESLVVIKTDEEAAYHQGLANDGFTYKEVKPAQVVGSTCVGCEG